MATLCVVTQASILKRCVTTQEEEEEKNGIHGKDSA